jgi:hypothetical protein
VQIVHDHTFFGFIKAREGPLIGGERDANRERLGGKKRKTRGGNKGNWGRRKANRERGQERRTENKHKGKYRVNRGFSRGYKRKGKRLRRKIIRKQKHRTEGHKRPRTKKQTQRTGGEIQRTEEQKSRKEPNTGENK